MLIAAYLVGRGVLPATDGAAHAAIRWGLSGVLYVAAAVACFLRAAIGRRDRLAWALMGAGATAYLVGTVITGVALDASGTTAPLAAHAAWLAFYPLAYAALVLLARATLRPFTLAFALDGIIGAVALAAVVAALAFPSVQGDFATADIVGGLCYPAGDLLLVGFAAWVAMMVGWRTSAMWRWLVAAFGLLLLGDLALVAQAASAGFGEDTVSSTVFAVAFGVLGLAAWQERGRPRTLRPDVAALLTFPAAAVVVVLVVLVVGEPLGLNAVAEYLCFGVLVLAFLRMVLVSQHVVGLQEGQRFQQGFEEAKTGMAIVDARLRWQRVNPAMAALLGRSAQALVGGALLDAVPESDRAQLGDVGRDALRTGEPIRGMRVRLMGAEGGVCDVELDAAVIEGDDGAPQLFAQIRDVTAELKAERHGAAVARLTRAALDEPDVDALMEEIADVVGEAMPASLVLIVMVDQDGPGSAQLAASRPRLPDDRAALVTRFPGQRAYTRDVGVPVVANDLDREERFVVAAPLLEAGVKRSLSVPAGPRDRPSAVLLAHRRGHRPPFTPEDVRFLEAVGNLLTSALERAGSEAEHRHRALHDPLTGLANRALLAAHLEHALVAAERQEGDVALLLVDLDRFKSVNDTMGHTAGDALLNAVADRLRDRARGGDLVARLGGDEFVVVFDAVASVHEVVPVARRLLEAIAEPVAAGEREVVVSGSIGIVVADRPGVRPDELLRDADVAMYRAKAGGGARYELFDADLRARVVDRLEIEHGLRRAVERGELAVHLQPMIDLVSERPTGFEALVRWQRPEPDPGLVAPGAFIGVAEETGLIVPLGQWVLREACRHAAALQEPGGPAIRISVNLSARQITEDLVGDVRAALEDAGLPPHLLMLEITESLLITDAGAAGVLSSLRALGVSLALDDFGTGFSSLSALQRHAVDTLKLDRTMIQAVARSGTSAAIARAAVDMAGALGVRVVAEGIEDGEQLQVVRDLGCHVGQGFLFSRPMPADDAAAYLRAGSWRTVFATGAPV